MTEVWSLAALWFALALAAVLFSIWLRIANALSEILVGIATGLLIGTTALGADASCIKFLAGDLREE